MSFKWIPKMLFLIGTGSRKIPIIIFASLVVSLLDIFGIALIGPFISLTLVDTGQESSLTIFLMSLTGANSNNELLTIFGIVLILTFAIKNFSSWALQSWIISYVYETEKKLRLNISEIILRMNLLHLNSSESSHHINVTTRHITQFSLQILYASLKLFSEGIAIIFIIIFLFYLYPIPSLIILSILLLTTISYLAIVGNSLKAAGQKAAAANSSIINIMSNLISGIREIRVYGIENFFKNLMKQQSTKHKDAYYQYTTKQLIPRYMIETVLMTMLVSIAIFMFWFGYDQAAIISMIGVLAVAAIRMMPGIVILTNSINNIINAQVILNELHDLYKHISSSNPQLKPLENTKNNRSEFKDLEMKKVSYSYPESSKSVISELNFKIHKGESIGLVGKSGAGKTTLVNLILGFLEDYDGEILFNGGTMKKVSYGDWLQYLSYIPQDKFLINDSIKSNIALGIDQENINLNLLQDSISLANLDDLVSSLDDGEDFIIGENGNKLSGGQRQRICLARAFYFNREIIILDEATSSLDNDTEKQIMNEIHALKGKKTFIIISHKPSTLEGCDKVFEISNGRLLD